jgi:hypothetical protein
MAILREEMWIKSEQLEKIFYSYMTLCRRTVFIGLS